MKNTKGLLLILALVFIAAFSRIIPHLPNFTAIGAMTLFGSAYFSKKYLAIIAPLLAMWLSDLVINNVMYAEYNEGFVWFTSIQLFVYLPILLITILGFILLNKISIKNIAIGSIIFPITFFLISNFGTWISGMSLFPDSLLKTYIAGLPYLRNDIIGTLLFSTIMFGSYYFITKSFPSFSLRKNTFVKL